MGSDYCTLTVVGHSDESMLGLVPTFLPTADPVFNLQLALKGPQTGFDLLQALYSLLVSHGTLEHVGRAWQWLSPDCMNAGCANLPYVTGLPQVHVQAWSLAEPGL